MATIFFGIILLPVFLIVLGGAMIVIADLISGEKKEPEKMFREPDWRDGMIDLEMDVQKYEKYAGDLIVRYPVAMNETLPKIHEMYRMMSAEEIRRVRSEMEERFDEVVRESEARRRKTMGERLDREMEMAFKESRFVD